MNSKNSFRKNWFIVEKEEGKAKAIAAAKEERSEELAEAQTKINKLNERYDGYLNKFKEVIDDKNISKLNTY